MASSINDMMSEQEWLTSADPRKMLDHLTEQDYGHIGRELRIPPLISDRQLRLWVSAVAQLDGLAFHENTFAYWLHGNASPHDTPGMPLRAASKWASLSSEHPSFQVRADLLRDIVGNRWKPVPVFGEVPFGSVEALISDAELYRQYLTPTVIPLAQTAYNDLSSDGSLDPLCLSAVADALEENGYLDEHCIHCVSGVWGEYENGTPIYCNCGYHNILTSLRLPTPRYRGLWSLDLILGKE